MILPFMRAYRARCASGNALRPREKALNWAQGLVVKTCVQFGQIQHPRRRTSADLELDSRQFREPCAAHLGQTPERCHEARSLRRDGPLGPRSNVRSLDAYLAKTRTPTTEDRLLPLAGVLDRTSVGG